MEPASQRVDLGASRAPDQQGDRAVSRDQRWSEATIVERDAPGLIVPPPVIYLPAVVLGVLTDRLWPVALLPGAVQYGLGGLFIVLSVSIMPFVLREFSKAHTHFDARKPVTALITSGPFRFSRNPSYLALTLLCVGSAIISDTVWIIAWLVLAVLLIDKGIIQREERFLEEKFGEVYRSYKAKVRRWL
jgi:protein-S-isoprenylcysteine O-methyltransferase Ste14